MDWVFGKRRGRPDRDATNQDSREPSPPTANGTEVGTPAVASVADGFNPAIDGHDPLVNNLFSDEIFRAVVKLPFGLDEREWMATNTIPFFNNTSVAHSAVTDFCTSTSCPTMCITPNWPLYWLDDKGKKKKCSALKYGDLALSFIQKHINDEALFPTKRGIPFPLNFETNLRRVYRLMFQILAHNYANHLIQLNSASLGSHLVCVFKHLILFSLEFHLIDIKELKEMESPVSDLVRRLTHPKGSVPEPSPSPIDSHLLQQNNGANSSGNNSDAASSNGGTSNGPGRNSGSPTSFATSTTTTTGGNGGGNHCPGQVNDSPRGSPSLSQHHLQLQPVA